MADCKIKVPVLQVIEIQLDVKEESVKSEATDHLIEIQEHSNKVSVRTYNECDLVEVSMLPSFFLCSGDSCKIGLPSDQNWEDGAAEIDEQDSIADAVDKVNEVLKYLIPDAPKPLKELYFDQNPVSAFIANHSNIAPLTAGQLFEHVFNSKSITMTILNGERFGDADKGNLILLVNDNEVDSFDLAGNFNENERNGNQSYPPATSQNGGITITSIGMYNNFPPYQKGSGYISLNNFIGVGYNKIQLKHSFDNNNVLSDEYSLFYDDAGRPTVSLFNFSINHEVIKWLSGIKYYTLGTEFRVLIEIIDLFNKTYISQPVKIYGSGLDVIRFTWNTSGSSGYSNPPNYNDVWDLDKIIEFNKEDAGKDIVFTVTPSDAFGEGSPESYSLSNHLYNTYLGGSNDKSEYFTDELYRLPRGDYDSIPQNITNNWDSTAKLDNGDAQVFVDELVYPHEDFSQYYPQQESDRDYSNFSGNQEYLRAFRDSLAHNSGTLEVRGITLNNLGNDIDIFIKLPSQTGWLDCSKPFSAATFNGNDGDGCQVSVSKTGDVLKIKWTSGTFSTANSGYMVIVKIILKNTSVSLKELHNFRV